MLEFGDFSSVLSRSGISKKKFAEICGVHPTTVTRWLKDPSLVPADVYHLAARLSFFVDYELKKG